VQISQHCPKGANQIWLRRTASSHERHVLVNFTFTYIDLQPCVTNWMRKPSAAMRRRVGLVGSRRSRSRASPRDDGRSCVGSTAYRTGAAQPVVCRRREPRTPKRQLRTRRPGHGKTPKPAPLCWSGDRHQGRRLGLQNKRLVVVPSLLPGWSDRPRALVLFLSSTPHAASSVRSAVPIDLSSRRVTFGNEMKTTCLSVTRLMATPIDAWTTKHSHLQPRRTQIFLPKQPTRAEQLRDYYRVRLPIRLAVIAAIARGSGLRMTLLFFKGLDQA
jgi:hypothetical protein